MSCLKACYRRALTVDGRRWKSHGQQSVVHGLLCGHGGAGGCRAQSRHRVAARADTRRLRLGVHAAGVGSSSSRPAEAV